MKFHEFRTWWDFHKTKLAQFGREYSYAKQIEILKRMHTHGVQPGIAETLPGKNTKDMDVYVGLLENEAKWYDNRRPYYKVYPCVVDALSKLKLEFNCPCPKVPEGEICIRFAEGHEPKKEGNSIAALLVHSESGNDKKTGEQKEVLFIQVTLKEKPDNYYWLYFDTNNPDMTIEECLNQNPATENYDEIRKIAIRIALNHLPHLET